MQPQPQPAPLAAAAAAAAAQQQLVLAPRTAQRRRYKTHRFCAHGPWAPPSSLVPKTTRRTRMPARTVVVNPNPTPHPPPINTKPNEPPEQSKARVFYDLPFDRTEILVFCSQHFFTNCMHFLSFSPANSQHSHHHAIIPPPPIFARHSPVAFAAVCSIHRTHNILHTRNTTHIQNKTPHTSHTDRSNIRAGAAAAAAAAATAAQLRGPAIQRGRPRVPFPQLPPPPVGPGAFARLPTPMQPANVAAAMHGFQQ